MAEFTGFRLGPLGILLLAICHYVFASVGFSLAIPPGLVTTLWPPTGLALAAVLLWGARGAAGVFLGAVLANVQLIIGSGFVSLSVFTLLLSCGISLSATVQAVLSAWLVKRFSSHPNWRLQTFRQLLALVFLGGVVGSLVNASLGNGVLFAFGPSDSENLWRDWGTWYVRDMVGVLVFAPVFLLLLQPQSEVPRRRKLQVALPVTLLVCLHVAAQIDSEQRVLADLREHLNGQSRELTRNIQNRIDGYRSVVGGLRGLFLASDEVDAAQFETFARATMEIASDIEALQWIPVVSEEARESWEQKAGGPDGESLTIREWADGELTPALVRERYFPVKYLYPASISGDARGFDLGTEPAARDAIEQALAGGDYVSSAAMLGTQGEGGVGAVLLMRAMPDGSGVAAGLVRIDRLFDEFLQNFVLAHLEMSVRDAETGTILFAWPMQPAAGQWQIVEPMEYGATLQMGGRDWLLQTSLKPEFVETTLFNRLWPFLASGYVVIGLLSMISIYASGSADAVEQQVVSRTRELADERQFLDQIFNQLPLIAYVKEPDSLRYLRTNHLFTDETGVTAEEAVGRSDHELFPEAQAQRFVELDRQVLSGRQVIVAEQKVELGGAARWFRNYKMPITDVAGNIRFILGLAEDITERREQEVVFNTLVESLPTALLVVARDAKVRYYNSAAESLFELEERGVDMEMLLPESAREAHRGMFRRYFESPGSRPMGVGRELRAQTVSGREFPAEIALAPLQWRGEPCVLVLVNNVSERRQVLQALRRSEERLRFLLDHLGEGVIGLDLEGNATFVNPAAEAMIGFEGRELIGRPLYQRIHHSRPDGRPWKDDESPSLRPETLGESRRVEDEVFWRRNGQCFAVEYVSSPVRDAGGALTGAVVVFTDITARKQLQSRLLRSNEELDSFAYIASHDLKEPLRGISNYASFLLEDYEKLLDDDGREMLHSLVRLSNRMENLISDLLNYSRLGRTELAEEVVPLQEIVDDVLDSLGPRLAELKVSVETETELPSLYCDRVRIAELYRNLVTNAMKYSDREQPWVAIGAIRRGDRWVMYVKDNGIGIPERFQEKIFRVFKRLHTQEEYGGGTGIGLSIVQKIVDRHEGEIWVESKPEQGSTFYFTLA